MISIWSLHLISWHITGLNWIFLLNFLFCVGIWPVNNIVIVSGGQQRDWAIHIHVCILPHCSRSYFWCVLEWGLKPCLWFLVVCFYTVTTTTVTIQLSHSWIYTSAGISSTGRRRAVNKLAFTSISACTTRPP